MPDPHGDVGSPADHGPGRDHPVHALPDQTRRVMLVRRFGWSCFVFVVAALVGAIPTMAATGRL
ncbi:hypothetical protein [Streptomyces sp. NBC_01500]|uniref:hypothetical protein n=1 Tax=Streptomyces sp. NBC_01500 TaxID=2903886 RepID=UPI002257AEB6|nr:hypothetical protein [Streptomyces sp. NBC_01500]MCX4552267.1 hypothetical protein [Streptomyces sp. NBC_01500]